MSPLTIAALKEQTGEKPLLAAVHAQLQSRSTRTTKNGKPYLELSLADATGHFTLKIWSDSPVYQLADSQPIGGVLRVEGKWTQGSYGMECKDPEFHQPDPAALDVFYAGDPVLRDKQDRDYQEILRLCESIADPRLNALCRAVFPTVRRPLPAQRRRQTQPPRAPRRARRTRRADDALGRRAVRRLSGTQPRPSSNRRVVP